MGLEYAAVQDVAQALLKFASDTSINGELSALRSGESFAQTCSGRAFGIFPRSKVTSGYADLDSDDYKEGDFLKPWDDEISRVLARSNR